jgi:hypothetical protein
MDDDKKLIEKLMKKMVQVTMDKLFSKKTIFSKLEEELKKQTLGNANVEEEKALEEEKREKMRGELFQMMNKEGMSEKEKKIISMGISSLERLLLLFDKASGEMVRGMSDKEREKMWNDMKRANIKDLVN